MANNIRSRKDMNINRTEVIYFSNEAVKVLEKYDKICSLADSHIIGDKSKLKKGSLRKIIDDRELKILQKTKENLEKLLQKIIIKFRKGAKNISFEDDIFYNESDAETVIKKKINSINKMINSCNEIRTYAEEISTSLQKLFKDYNTSISWIPKSIKFEDDDIKYINLLQEYRNDENPILILDYDGFCKLKNEKSIEFWKISSPKEGQILIKHPFKPNTFIDVNTTESEIFNEKISKLSNIAWNLGAKSLKGDFYISDQKERQHGINGQIKFKKISLSGSRKKELENYYKRSIKLEDDFIVGDVAEWEKTEVRAQRWEIARKEAEESGLINDEVIKSLINKLNPNHPIRNTREKYSFNLTNEINENIDLAFDLEVKNINISPKYLEVLKNKKTVDFAFEIVFPQKTGGIGKTSPNPNTFKPQSKTDNYPKTSDVTKSQSNNFARKPKIVQKKKYPIIIVGILLVGLIIGLTYGNATKETKSESDNNRIEYFYSEANKKIETDIETHKLIKLLDSNNKYLLTRDAKWIFFFYVSDPLSNIITVYKESGKINQTEEKKIMAYESVTEIVNSDNYFIYKKTDNNSLEYFVKTPKGGFYSVSTETRKISIE